MVKDCIAYKYAQWCLIEDNHKVGIYIKKQAKIWKDIADGNDPEAFVDETQVKKIIKLLHLMIHPDLNRPLDECMEDYAWLLIIAVMCTKMKSEPDVRYYITAILEIARKNFKTLMPTISMRVLTLPIMSVNSQRLTLLVM